MALAREKRETLESERAGAQTAVTVHSKISSHCCLALQQRGSATASRRAAKWGGAEGADKAQYRTRIFLIWQSIDPVLPSTSLLTSMAQLSIFFYSGRRPRNPPSARLRTIKRASTSAKNSRRGPEIARLVGRTSFPSVLLTQFRTRWLMFSESGPSLNIHFLRACKAVKEDSARDCTRQKMASDFCDNYFHHRSLCFSVCWAFNPRVNFVRLHLHVITKKTNSLCA